jgi:fructose-1,6-bisphosphatase/inositol monophosphatase family enzyme
MNGETMVSTHEELEWLDRLTRLGFEVRRRLRGLPKGEIGNLTRPVAKESGDTIYGIDRQVEPVIEASIEQWPASCKPLVLVAEGMGRDGTCRYGQADALPKYRVIIDPIDGTRSLMYDKRSAWFLAAVAPELESDTRLSGSIASVIVELPTTKQCAADHFVATAHGAAKGFRIRLDSGHREQIAVRSSTATTLQDGFAQVSNFFPGTKVLAAELMERIALRTLGAVRAGRADVFDDQYISTGGQLVELIVGHDRFCCDLRPLLYDIVDQYMAAKTPRGIECHPYDLAGMLVAKQSGVILTDGFGKPLDGPLDVHHGMHWCGYANRMLQNAIQPVIREWLHEHGVYGPSVP